MLRRGGRYTGGRVALAASIGCASRPMSATSTKYQLQHRGRLVEKTHGAGLVKHQSMANIDEGQQRIPRGVTRAAPAADLFRTSLHEGLDTSAEDPYFRTLPNQESRAPESTVLRSAAVTAPTQDEVAKLGKRLATMQYWLGDTFPRLPVFLRSLVVPNALQVSAHAEKLIQDLTAQLPEIMRGASAGDRDKVAALWKKALEDYGAVGTRNIFDRATFEKELASVHQQCIAEVGGISKSENVLLAFEVLRRKAVLKRNRFIEEGLVPLVSNGKYLGYGDGVWRVFFLAVEQQQEKLFAGEANRMLSFAWDAIMKEDAAVTPSVSAVVALYLTLLSMAQSEAVVDTTYKAASRFIDEGTAAQGGASAGVQQEKTVSPSITAALSNGKVPQDLLDLVNPITKRKFAAEALQQLLSTANGVGSLSKALRAAGMHALSREAALCEAMMDNKRLLAGESAPLVEFFDSTLEVKSLLASIMAGTNAEAKRHVLQTFGQSSSTGAAAKGGSGKGSSSGGSVDWEKVFLAVDWDSNWRNLTAALLSDTATLEAIGKIVGAAIGAKGSVKRLFSPAYAEAMTAVIGARKEREASMATRVKGIVEELSSFRQVDFAIRLLQDLGVPLKALAEEALSVEQTLRHSRPTVEPAVMEALLAEIAKRHPSWPAAGVLPADLSLGKADGALTAEASAKALSVMVRMYVRLAYTPHAGAAAIAQHTRRRIGPIGTEAHQFNVPTEVGFVEQFDNLQYKRYDWQGWYQRMTDIHNRNVSLRCRIDDLKRLDGRGTPFVDLQTERRLRILAGERVGMGVLKLDSDKFEDWSDNVTHGVTKLSEVLAESRKAQLGPEYWPTVEVKVRRPSGQSQAYYSTIDNERIEKRSAELYEKYRDAKKRSLFVTPMDLWLEVKGMQVRKTAENADVDGYTVDTLQDSLGNE